MSPSSTLYIVATPIGHLADISLRALEVLKNVDLIAAEDTRHSARLLQHYEITTRLISYHDHSDQKRVDMLIDKLKMGQSIALISDAGTPLISDPGYVLVKCAREAKLNVEPIPGSCAVIAALSASGLACSQFSFEGFTPPKSVARKRAFSARLYDTRTLVYYESPHRIIDCLQDLEDVMGGKRQMVLARELTKTFETFLSGSVSEVAARVSEDANQRKGEIVILVAGFNKDDAHDDISDEGKNTMKVLAEELPVKQAAGLCAKLTGDKKNKLYQWWLAESAE